MTVLKKYLLLILCVSFITGMILAANGSSLNMMAKIACFTVLLITSVYLFIKSRVLPIQLETDNLDEANSIIHSGHANHFKNIEAVGGKLFLLQKKLQFQSHGLNVQNEATVININEIKEVGFYNTLGFIPNGLAISTQNGHTEKFVVNKRMFWKNAIEKQRSQL